MAKKRCPFCNNTGKVWDSLIGNFVPCETENDCLAPNTQY